jgi:hypothetical protein
MITRGETSFLRLKMGRVGLRRKRYGRHLENLLVFKKFPTRSNQLNPVNSQ